MEHLSNDHKYHPNHHENSHEVCDKKGHRLLGLKEGKSMETKTKTWSEFSNEGNATVERILGSEGKKNVGRGTVRVVVMDPCRKIIHLIKVVWDRNSKTAFISSISSTRIG